MKKLILTGIFVMPFFAYGMYLQDSDAIMIFRKQDLKAFGMFGAIIQDSEQTEPRSNHGKAIAQTGQLEIDFYPTYLKPRELQALCYLAQRNKAQTPEDRQRAHYKFALKLLPDKILEQQTFMNIFKEHQLQEKSLEQKKSIQQYLASIDQYTKKALYQEASNVKNALQSIWYESASSTENTLYQEKSLTSGFLPDEYPCNTFKSENQLIQHIFFYTFRLLQHIEHKLLRTLYSIITTKDVCREIEESARSGEEGAEYGSEQNDQETNIQKPLSTIAKLNLQNMPPEEKEEESGCILQ